MKYSSPVRWLIVDAEAITGVDFSAGRALVDMQADLARKGVVLVLARVNDGLRADLDSLDVTRAIGSDRIFRSRKHCLDACRAEIPAPANTAPLNREP